MRPNNAFVVKCASRTAFYRAWMEVLTPYHYLTAREKDVAARILAQYFRLRDGVSDPVLLKEVMWTQSSREEMRESLGMTKAHFQMVLRKLRDVGILNDGEFNVRYIPNIHEGESRLCLGIKFDWSDEGNPADGAQQD